jgi:hypothetical protein
MPAGLAVIVGRFIGGVLRECAPVLASILATGIKMALTSTVENSAPDMDLRARLNAQLKAYLETLPHS